MSKIDFQTELHRNSGLSIALKVKEHDYDNIEFTLTKKMVDVDGKVIIDSYYQSFFTEREMKDFLQPLVNEMKVRFENGKNL